MELIITDQIRIPSEELRFSFVRSSGPGGQNVNKVSSKAVLRWNPGGPDEKIPMSAMERLKRLYPSRWTSEGEIVLSSQRTRDALKNKADCLEKLRTMILHGLREPKRRIPTRPTKSSVRRRLENKAKNAQKKQNRKKVVSD